MVNFYHLFVIQINLARLAQKDVGDFFRVIWTYSVGSLSVGVLGCKEPFVFRVSLLLLLSQPARSSWPAPVYQTHHNPTGEV